MKIEQEFSIEASADSNGMWSSISGVRRVVVSACDGRIAERAGTSWTSSKVRANGVFSPSI